MIYTTKEECYKDVLTSLMVGMLQEDEVRHLKEFYEEIEHYECCQGIIEAYIEYDRWRKQTVEDTPKGTVSLKDKSNGDERKR